MLYYLGSHRWLWGKGGVGGLSARTRCPRCLRSNLQLTSIVLIVRRLCFHTLSTLDRSSISPGQHESPSARPPLLRLLDTRLIPARGPHHIRPRSRVTRALTTWRRDTCTWARTHSWLLGAVPRTSTARSCRIRTAAQEPAGHTSTAPDTYTTCQGYLTASRHTCDR